MQVHDPLQVPHIYKQDVCQYRDTQRYFYSAMVSALDHSVDLVVQSLKQNNMYDNTIIVFTTDNGGAVTVGGNNWPLRGTKGTLFEVGIYNYETMLMFGGHDVAFSIRAAPAASALSTPRC